MPADIQNLLSCLEVMKRTYLTDPTKAVRGQGFIYLLHDYCVEELVSVGVPREKIFKEATVFGSHKPKDVDVAVIDEVNGPFIIVGIRSQMSSVGKNILTYYEEIIGDCISLHDRFPMAVEVDKCMLDYYEYKFLSSARNNCYNHFICNATKEGLTIDDYIKNKMSYARKNKRKVYQYTVNGEFVAVFGSIISAAKATGTNHKDISANCNHKLKSANYYFWSFVELKKEEIAAIHNSKKCKVDAVYCFNKNGDLFKVFETVKQCATYFGVSCSTIKRRLTSSTTTKVINHSIDDFIFSYSPKGC